MDVCVGVCLYHVLFVFLFVCLFVFECLCVCLFVCLCVYVFTCLCVVCLCPVTYLLKHITKTVNCVRLFYVLECAQSLVGSSVPSSFRIACRFSKVTLSLASSANVQSEIW